MTIPDSVTDPELRADIAEVSEFYSRMPPGKDASAGYDSPQTFVRDPGASDFLTKNQIASFFYDRDGLKTSTMSWAEAVYIAGVPVHEDGYTDAKDYGDLLKARRWYQMMLTQLGAADYTAQKYYFAKSMVEACDAQISNRPTDIRHKSTQTVKCGKLGSPEECQ